MGYEDTASLPAFDRSAHWSRGPDGWVDAPRAARGELLLRIAVPARSRRHAQAAVHTVWIPGSPVHPKQRACQFYGFRRTDSVWSCTATSGADIYDGSRPRALDERA